MTIDDYLEELKFLIKEKQRLQAVIASLEVPAHIVALQRKCPHVERYYYRQGMREDTLGNYYGGWHELTCTLCGANLGEAPLPRNRDRLIEHDDLLRVEDIILEA